MLRKHDSLVRADAVLALLHTLWPEEDAPEHTVSTYRNGRENGYRIGRFPGRAVAFAEARTSDRSPSCATTP